MAREILFRGLRTDGKGWVYGSLILPNIENENIYIQGSNGTKYKVIPESVGQFTGLTDYNGIKIFEGDKLEVQTSKGLNVHTVEWVNFETYTGFRCYGDNRRFNVPLSNSRLWNGGSKIIGNIHEQK